MSSETTAKSPAFVLDDDDDDDMADLFSFGTDPDDGPATASVEDDVEVPGSVRERTGSDDSLLNMLASETPIFTSTGTAAASTDKASKEILEWLDDDASSKPKPVDEKEDECNENKNPENSSLEQPTEVAVEPTVVALPPVFDSFHQALHASQATNSQIRDLYSKELSASPKILLSALDRQQLYCRLILNKLSVQDVLESSLANSFEGNQDGHDTWLQEQASLWAEGVATLTSRKVPECTEDLSKLLRYYLASHKRTEIANDGDEEKPSSNMDPLLPAVAATVLATGLPVAAASVVFGQIVPTYMPLVAMESQERWEAALSLHTDLYRLACYHLPFLVYHLDQYAPGWHWPRVPVLRQFTTNGSSATALSRNLQKRGQIPPSWLLAHFCGECNDSDHVALSPGILELWDRTLLLQASELRFFLVLVVLQEASEELLLLTGETLLKKLQSVLASKPTVDASDWWTKAQFLQSRTPDSVIRHLKQSEDKAVQEAVQRRQERAEEAMRARLQEEAEAHRLAQEKKAEEARERLTRARLVAFYRKHAPDKENNIDVLMEKYRGRYEELDARVKKKYGEGFNPAIAKPIPPKSASNETGNGKGPNNFLQTMRSKKDTASSKDGEDEDETDVRSSEVSVLVSPDDVLPVLCWSREATARRGTSRRHSRQRKALKFYLVDSRSEEAAQEQGRFPTAVSLSPEAMHDPERIQQNEEMFESLRGAVHIVVMGEGFSALSKLYSQRMAPNLRDLATEDDSRTNICALFFIKKGFPFVSVLDGGFAAAHSWLVREGPKRHLSVSSVLVDYDPEASLFGQMETYHNASTTERAQRTMQRMLENSLVSMTRSAQRLERLANDAEQADRKQGLAKINNIFRRSKSTDGNSENPKVTDTDGESQSNFRNPIALLRRQYSDDKEDSAPKASHEPVPAAKPEVSNVQPPSEKASAPTASDISQREQPSQTPRGNPFKGLGSALTNTATAANPTRGESQSDTKAAQAVPNVLKRNPFARFGGGNRQPQKQPGGEKRASSANAAAARGLAGLNQFRKSTMARMRQQNGNGEAVKPKEEEEAISFDIADDGLADLSLKQESAPDVKGV